MRETVTELPPLSVVLPNEPERPLRRALSLDQPWRLVCTVAVPFWLGVSAMRLVSFELTVMGGPGVILFPWWIRAVQHVVVLLVAIVGYRVALDIGWPDTRAARVRAALCHLGLGLTVALCARPILLLIGSPLSPPPEAMQDMPMPEGWGPVQNFLENLRGYGLRLWAASALDFLVSYFFGLALLTVVRTTLELRDAEIQRSGLENAWMQSRLQALRMQLNPHFLFNALNTVATLLETQPARARNLTVNLSHLLRGALDAGTQEWTTLGAEADYATLYLAIQAVRFEARLSYDISLDVDTHDLRVPAMILQPLVENAVVHGAADDRDRLQVWVKAQRVAGEVVIEVGNRSSGTLGETAPRVGVGLANTRARIGICYGGRALFEQRREDRSTYLVTLRLPIDAGARQ